MKPSFTPPETIPLFPLPGALLLPRGRLPLNIFEPRYLAMIEDCLKTPHRLIGMIQPRSKNESEDNLHDIGCAGRITSFSEVEDGRYLVTLTGFGRFRLLNAESGFTPYKRGDISWGDFAQDQNATLPDNGFDRPEFLKLLETYFRANGLSSDWEGLKDADEELLVNTLSMLCPFSVEEKQALLESPDLTNRRETLVTLMRFSLVGDEGPIQ